MFLNRKLYVAIVVLAILAGSFFAGTMIQPSGSREIWQTNNETGSMRTGGVELPLMPDANPTVNQDRMVVYNAYIALETSGIQEAISKIESLADKYGGYVAGTSISSSRIQTITEISIRIPRTDFHNVVDLIRNYGKVLEERTTSDDVTQQYVDLKAHLVNLQEQETRLREILGMAKTVEDVLNVERELERVRGDLESLQGQVNYLEGNVEMSSIAVRLIEPAPSFITPRIDWSGTLQTALTGLFTTIRGLIILAFTMIPLVAVAGPAFYLYKRRTRKTRLHVEAPVIAKE